jgi:polygalacturonase
MAARRPPENELGYPEATMFGDLPATGFFVRHARGLSMRGVEVVTAAADPRPAIRLEDVADAEFAGMRLPRGVGYSLDRVSDFASTGARRRDDRRIAGPFSGNI